MSDKIFWSDDFQGTAKGGYYFRAFDLVKFIKSVEDIIRGIIHEYIHYLQSGSWMKRYYSMGYTYGNHPYEVDAKKAEEDWKKFA